MVSCRELISCTGINKYNWIFWDAQLNDRVVSTKTRAFFTTSVSFNVVETLVVTSLLFLNSNFLFELLIKISIQLLFLSCILWLYQSLILFTLPVNISWKLQSTKLRDEGALFQFESLQSFWLDNSEHFFISSFVSLSQDLNIFASVGEFIE